MQLAAPICQSSRDSMVMLTFCLLHSLNVNIKFSQHLLVIFNFAHGAWRLHKRKIDFSIAIAQCEETQILV